MHHDKTWEYNGHRCEIEVNRLEDDIETYFWVVKPGGVQELVPITRGVYTAQRAIELWIDLGYPGRQISPSGVDCPLTEEDLQGMELALSMAPDPWEAEVDSDPLGW